eukprot:15459705-Alexandrium_andersonii.AAC.1
MCGCACGCWLRPSVDRRLRRWSNLTVRTCGSTSLPPARLGCTTTSTRTAAASPSRARLTPYFGRANCT